MISTFSHDCRPSLTAAQKALNPAATVAAAQRRGDYQAARVFDRRKQELIVALYKAAPHLVQVRLHWWWPSQDFRVDVKSWNGVRLHLPEHTAKCFSLPLRKATPPRHRRPCLSAPNCTFIQKENTHAFT